MYTNIITTLISPPFALALYGYIAASTGSVQSIQTTCFAAKCDETKGMVTLTEN